MKGFRFFRIYFVLIFIIFAAKAQKIDVRKELSELSARARKIYLNQPDSAILLSRQVAQQAIQTKDHYHEGYAYFLLSKAYWVKANYQLSTEYGFKALRFFENSEYKPEWSESLLSVSRTLSELGNNTKATELIGQSIRLARQESDEQMLANSYREKSFVLSQTKQLDSALMYSDKGLALFEKAGDTLSAGILYGRKGRIYFVKEDYEQSRKYALKAMLLDSIVGNMRGLGISCFLVAQNEHALHNFKKAELLLHRSIRINYGIGNLVWLIHAHELLSDLYMETKRPELAAQHLQLASHYKDGLYDAEKSGQIQEMQSLYELESKEKTILLLERENALREQQVRNQRLFLVSSLAGIFLLVLVLFFLTRLRTIQKKTNRDLQAKNVAIEQQREEMQAQAEKMQQLNQLQTKLFSVISHDLRGPISNLHGLLELFSKKMMTPQEMTQVSDKLKSNLNVTQRTLENLLSWALSQMDGIKTDKQPIDVKHSVEEACRLMEETARRKSVSIEKTLNGGMMVMADPDQIQLVLRNLIHNGIKFSKIGDSINIRTAAENNLCRIIIQDSGIGMSQDEIDRIVGSIQHFTKVGTQQEKGTGLGLLLCKEFISRNGGSFDIQSRIGEGTEISFTLERVIR
jgi:two-component system, sensor histidine kinase and response regulator